MRLRGGDSDEEVSGSMEEDDDGDGVEIDIKEIKVDRPDYVMERHEFNHVIRVLNTNIDGTRTVSPPSHPHTTPKSAGVAAQ